MAVTSSITTGWGTVALVLCGFATHAAAQTQYSVTDLGTLTAFNVSQAGGINTPGQVAGSSSDTVSGVDHGFVWTSGSLQDVGTLGFSSSAAVGINDSGQASGEVYNSAGPSHAFWWSSGAGLTDIHMSASFTSSEALGTVNAAGQIVGSLTRADGGLTHPFQWSGGSGMADLGPMPGMTDGFASNINDSGQVVGTSWNATDGRAFLWTSGGGFTDLGTPPGFQYAWATAINASGQVVGQASNNTGPIDGFMWTAATGMTDLGPLPGFLYIQPYAINGPGVVVGQASNDPQTSGRAFVWQNGVMTDLNTLIPGDSGWVLRIATGINDGGQITGTGTVGGQTHAFLLTPTP
jgi:probable HAF family extracellular repeat protein